MRLACVLLLCMASSAWADGRDWIGREVPPYPGGRQSLNGGCIGTGNTREEVCAYGMSEMDDAQGRPRYLIAERSLRRNPPRWIITDVIAYPRLRQEEYLSRGTCQRDGVDDPSVAAVVDTRDAQEMYETVRWAVRVEQGQFVEIPTAGIRCYIEGE